MHRATAALAFGAAMLGGAAAAAELAPHRALYVFELVSADRGSAVTGIDGRMMVDWSQSCDGWTLEHRLVLEAQMPEGGFTLASSVATWESDDGRDYRFSVRNQTGGEAIERLSGHARMAEGGAPGEARFAEPAPGTLVLPPGTLFPTGHSRLVIETAARSAPTLLTRTVFDGLTADGAFEVSAAVGQELPPGAEPLAALRGVRSWPVRLAYFAPGDRGPEPRHELGMRMYENGVADRLELDFGEFKVRADLAELELYEPPSCG